ncbi:DUF7446 family protein [Pantoea anthophila]|uniref:DUF7446 family protein n=1 Tax=Pantoea anthophila TaxID=470931 RepID=UPI003AFAD4B4
MANPITVGLSAITNTIFAGRSKPLKGGASDTRVFTGEKQDVTEQAIHAVAFHLMKADDIKVFNLPDGRELHLRADIKEVN